MAITKNDGRVSCSYMQTAEYEYAGTAIITTDFSFSIKTL